MSPNGRIGGKTRRIPDNLYTAVLAVAVGVVMATAAFVAYQCYTQYGVLFSIPKSF